MSEENEPKEIEPKSSRILFCYFVVVLLLGLVFHLPLTYFTLTSTAKIKFLLY